MNIFLFLLSFKMIISENITKQNIEQDNFNILSQKSESNIPHLNVMNIEYINFYEITDAKISIFSPQNHFFLNSYIIIKLPEDTDFYLNLDQKGICSKKNIKQYQCTKIKEYRNITILVENVFDRVYLMNEVLEFYITLKISNKNEGNIKQYYYFEIQNSNEDTYLTLDGLFVASYQIELASLFQVKITTEDCYVPTIYKIKYKINYFKLQPNGMYLFTFPKIFYGINTNDIIIKFYINENECINNFKYDLEEGKLLIKDFSKCLMKAKFSNDYIFDIKIFGLMSPRTTEDSIFEFFHLNKTGYVIQYSKDKVQAQYSKTLNKINLILSSFEAFDLATYQFLFTNENYLLKGDMIKIKSSREFYITKDPPSEPLNENITFYKVWENSTSQISTFVMSFKINYINEINKQINFTIKNVRNPHGRKLDYFTFQIYDQNEKNLVLDSKIDLYTVMTTKIPFTNLNVSMENATAMKFQFSATKFIEFYDLLQLFYDPYLFYISPCKTYGFTNLQSSIGCFNFKDNNTIFHPWAFNKYDIADSSYKFEYLLFDVYFKHTNKNYSQDYYFEYDLLDTWRAVKEDGNFTITIEFDCYYTCNTCDVNKKTFCTSCSEDFPFLMKDYGICLKKCPKSYSYNQDNICFRCNPMSNCEECDENDVNICTKCQSDFPYFIDGICYSYCPENYFPLNNICTNMEEYIQLLKKKYQEQDSEENNNDSEENDNDSEENNNEKEENNNKEENINNNEVIQNRINLNALRIDSEFIIPFDYFTILIIILGIIIFNHFLFWKKGYDYKFSSYIIFELSVLFKINLYFIYPLSIMTGEKLIFYSFSIMFTIEIIINSTYMFIYVIILGIKYDIFSLIISLFLDYKLLKIQNDNKLHKPMKKTILYCIYIIYFIDIFIHISSIIIGTYINSIFKQIEYLSNLIQYTIIVSIIILYFLIFDFVFPKNSKNEIKKENKDIVNEINEENNDIKPVQNELITLRTNYNPTTERARQESSVPFQNFFITNSQINN